jgi:hypothetical protein
MRMEWQQQRPYHNAGANHLPSMTLMPSHTAPTKPATIVVITALKV